MSDFRTCAHATTDDSTNRSVLSYAFGEVLLLVICQTLKYVLGKLRAAFLRSLFECAHTYAPDCNGLQLLYHFPHSGARRFRSQLAHTHTGHEVGDACSSRLLQSRRETRNHTRNGQKLGQTDSTATQLHPLTRRRVNLLPRLLLVLVHLLTSLGSTLTRSKRNLCCTSPTSKHGPRTGQRTRTARDKIRSNGAEATTDLGRFRSERIKLHAFSSLKT